MFVGGGTIMGQLALQNNRDDDDDDDDECLSINTFSLSTTSHYKTSVLLPAYY